MGGDQMIGKRRIGAVAGAFLLVASLAPRAYCGGFIGRNGIRHVLLISIDGMHALDYLNCKAGGSPYCPNLTALGTTGVNYLDTSSSKPSDSFPGLMSIVTGGSPRTMGVNYDLAFDRALNPPKFTTNNGLAGGPCTNPPSGTTTEYEEGININLGVGTGKQDQAFLNGGAPVGDGGVDSIDATRLERDENCNPVYPWNFIRVNTIYGVIHGAGGYTAWADKHPSYASIGGPTGTNKSTNVDDYFGPEINSFSSDFVTGAFPTLIPGGCNPLPDQTSASAGDDYTLSFQNIQCYDGIKVNAVINEIDGMNHDGTAEAKVPVIFGMNFQAVSVGQKLIYQHGTPPAPFSKVGGYADSIGTPSDSLKQEIMFVDSSIGRMVNELRSQGLLNSTLIVITAKHGQSPIDPLRYKKNGPPNDPASILSSCLTAAQNGDPGPTEDDVALLWLKPGCNVATEVGILGSPLNATKAGIGEIFSGPSIGLYWNADDSRAPDILVTPNIGVIYSNSGKKQAEHGGFAKDDVNVILLVSNPEFEGTTTVTTAVETNQVGPTILKALGLNPNSLQAVQKEGTQVLPGLPFKSGGSSFLGGGFPPSSTSTESNREFGRNGGAEISAPV
jgi:hypothetical protein